jgi:hypothetical protein
VSRKRRSPFVAIAIACLVTILAILFGYPAWLVISIVALATLGAPSIEHAIRVKTADENVRPAPANPVMEVPIATGRIGHVDGVVLLAEAEYAVVERDATSTRRSWLAWLGYMVSLGSSLGAEPPEQLLFVGLEIVHKSTGTAVAKWRRIDSETAVGLRVLIEKDLHCLEVAAFETAWNIRPPQRATDA